MIKSDQVLLYNWYNCPYQIRDQVNSTLDYFHHVLRDKLSGFYLHGSLTMGCFNPGKSDIDFLATVRQRMTTEEKKSIIRYLLDLGQDVPDIKIEMSIVTEESLRQIRYPSPFEVHYSDSLRDYFLNGEVDWNSQKYDEDLVMHFMAIRYRGICLYGPAIAGLFPEVSREMWSKSMVNDLIYIREHIDTAQATYAVLNPCRNLAFIREGKLLSEEEGGEWALITLPGEFTPIISQALADYISNQGNFRPDTAELCRFLEYASTEMV